MAGDNNQTRRFLVALSFPSEHRRFVRNVAISLAETLGRDRVFLDEWYPAELLGKNGDLKLQKIYRENSEIVVPFFSEFYQKKWCQLEWDAIREMLFERRVDDRVVPVKMDETLIDGWKSIDFHIDRKRKTGKQVSDLIINKCALLGLVSTNMAYAVPSSSKSSIDWGSKYAKFSKSYYIEKSKDIDSNESAQSTKQNLLNKLENVIQNAIENGSSIDTIETENIFIELYSCREEEKLDITSKFIEGMSSYEAGLFMLTLQYYYKRINISETVNSTTFYKLAEVATKDMFYKWVQIKLSLDGIISNEAGVNTSNLADEILQKHSGFIKVRLGKDQSYMRFYEKLNHTTNERVNIFSTTSQESNLTLEHINESISNITAINILLVSPLISEDSALIGLLEEYDVPKFAIPEQHQFLSASHYLDMARRVIKILIAIDSIVALAENSSIDIRLYLYRTAYPGVKFITFTQNKYMQIKVGALKYANNLYRFGFEVTDSSIVNLINSQIDHYINDSRKVRKQPLKEADLLEFKEKALNEISAYLSSNGVDVDEIEKNRSLFNLILKSDRANYYLDSIIKCYEKC